ncbi:MAG: cyclic nucleotide-binding domain-containing protein [Candidatus Methylacidiphilales bacterium]|nr:cyclic nucleotide-binding domain-containing protein [Candidatus Methylacidiphilales bacterium]
MAIHFSDISRMSLFRGFNENFIQLLDLFFREANYKAGAVLVQEGQLQRHFYMLVAGEVAVNRQVNGADVQLDILPAGQYFGEMNLFDPGVATASVVALTPVRTLEISNDKFRSFMTHKPELAADFTFQLAETIVKRFRTSTDLLTEELSRPEKIDLARRIDRGPVA